MKIELGQRLSQSLVMTPQLQQAIRLLQLSRLELIDEVRREMEANPVLADDDIDPRPRGEVVDAMSPKSGERPPEERIGETERFEMQRDLGARGEEKRAQEVDWEQFLENRTLQQSSYSGRSGFDELPPIEQSLTRSATLHDHLLWQLRMSDFTESERRFAEFIVGNLDERGYLDLLGMVQEDGNRSEDITIEDIAVGCGLDPEDAPEVLRLIQQLDPLGVASRDLRECLRVQADTYGFDELEVAVIDRHLHNLEKHNFQAIARDLKVPLEEVYEAAKEIQKLESRPARNFTDADDKLISITPDVYVVKDADRFVVLDNDRGVQRLYINESLTKRLLQDPNAKEFIGEKLRNAQWLIRAIEQRRKTIIRVTEAIVERQREFFEKGVAYLKPMILRDIAEAVSMHESTISRVTTNKYVHTPQGLFELKYFFNSSIRRVAEEDIASESVKQAIKKIIDEEDKQNPLSDQAIVELLEKREGIQIARRTVAKYREMLGILASSKRKKLFLATGALGPVSRVQRARSKGGTARAIERGRIDHWPRGAVGGRAAGRKKAVAMNIAITFRHLEASEPVKSYAHEKVGRLQRFLRQPMRARIIVDHENKGHRCEVDISAGPGRYIATETGEDMYACIDRVVDKLERQITGAHSSDVTRKKGGDSAGRFAVAISGDSENDSLP